MCVFGCAVGGIFKQGKKGKKKHLAKQVVQKMMFIAFVFGE